jgi:hypothetical protein
MVGGVQWWDSTTAPTPVENENGMTDNDHAVDAVVEYATASTRRYPGRVG